MSTEEDSHTVNNNGVNSDVMHFGEESIQFVKTSESKKSVQPDSMLDTHEYTPPSFGLVSQTSDPHFNKHNSSIDSYSNRGNCDFPSCFTPHSIESPKLNPLLAIASHQWFDRLFHSHQINLSSQKDLDAVQQSQFKFSNESFPADSSGSYATFYGLPDSSESTHFPVRENEHPTRLKVSMNSIERNESFVLSESEHLHPNHNQRSSQQANHLSDQQHSSMVYENAFNNYCPTSIYGSDLMSTTDFMQPKTKSISNDPALTPGLETNYMNSSRRSRSVAYDTEQKSNIFHEDTHCQTPDQNETDCSSGITNITHTENPKYTMPRCQFPESVGRRINLEQHDSKSIRTDLNVSEWQLENGSSSTLPKNRLIPDMSNHIPTLNVMNSNYINEDRLPRLLHRDHKIPSPVDPEPSEVGDLIKEPLGMMSTNCCEADLKQNEDSFSDNLPPTGQATQLNGSQSEDLLPSWRTEPTNLSNTIGDHAFFGNSSSLKFPAMEDKPFGTTTDWNFGNRYMSKRRNLESDNQNPFGTSMNVDMISYIPHNLLSSLANPCHLQSSHFHENHYLFPPNNQFVSGNEIPTDSFDHSDAQLNFCHPNSMSHTSAQYNQLIQCQNEGSSTTSAAAAAAAAMATNLQTNLNCYILPQMNCLSESGHMHPNTSQLRNRLTNGSGLAQNHNSTIPSLQHCPQRCGPNLVHQQPVEIDYNPRELEAFSELFKQRRIKLGVTQADVGKALGNLKIAGVGSLSQSTICRFESLTLSHNNMVALKPVLQAWLEEAEAEAAERLRHPEIYDPDEEKSRKRTSITDSEKRSLEAFFSIQPRPSSEKISQIADKLNLKKNVVRVWFCNQRQKQKRMKFSTLGLLHHPSSRN